jgi:hypothetical protein
MCILNGIQIWPIDVILHIFQENPIELPYIYASERCNKNVCEQVIHYAYDKSFTKIKARETYVLSTKTEQFDLTNWNLRFFQAIHRSKKSIHHISDTHKHTFCHK